MSQKFTRYSENQQIQQVVNDFSIKSVLSDDDRYKGQQFSPLVKQSKNSKITKPFQRRKDPDFIQKRNRDKIGSPKFSYLSPGRKNWVPKTDQMETRTVISDNGFQYSDLMTQRQHKNSQNIFQSKQFQAGSKSTMILKNLQNQTQAKKIAENEYSEHLQRIKYLTSINNKLSCSNKQLTEANNCLKKQLELQLSKSRIQSQQNIAEIQKIKQNYQNKLNQLKEVNLCLEDIIQGLNLKVQQLLQEQHQHDQKYHNTFNDFDYSTYDGQNQFMAYEKHCTSLENIPDSLPLIDPLLTQRDQPWQQIRIEQLEKENAILQQRLSEMSKNMKYYELQSSLSKKIRDELTLEKSMRQALENKNKILTDRLEHMIQARKVVAKKNTVTNMKSLNLQKTKRQKNKNSLESDDSLSFSIEIE